MAKIKLKQIVQEFIDSADGSVHQARRLYNIARRGAREFNMDIQGQFKSVLLDISANNTVAFPDDYLQYSKLGILNGAGEVMTLTHNEDLSTLHQAYLAQQNALVQVPSTNNVFGFGATTTFPFLWLNWNDGYNICHLYGLGGGATQLGQFTVDEDAQCFLLAPGFPYSTVMLEYLSDGFDSGCGDFLIDSRASEAMLAYVRWKQAQDLRKKFGANEVRYLRNEYYRERSHARLRLNAPNPLEMEKSFRNHVKLVARA